MVDIPPTKIYVNKIEDGIRFKIRGGYYLKLLTPETIKFFRKTKIKVTKNKYCKAFLHLEISKVVLLYCNNDYQQDSRVL